MSVEFRPTASGYHERIPCQARVDLDCELSALDEITGLAIRVARHAIEELLQQEQPGDPAKITTSFCISPDFLSYIAINSPQAKVGAKWEGLTSEQQERILKTFHSMDSFHLENIHQPKNPSELIYERYKYSIRPLYLKNGYQFGIIKPQDTSYTEKSGILKARGYDLLEASCFTWAFASAGIPLDSLSLATSSRVLGRPPKFTDYIQFLTKNKWEKASPPIQKRDIVIYFQAPGEEPTHAAFAISSTKVSAKWGNANHQAYFHLESLTPPEDGPYFLIYRKEN